MVQVAKTKPGDEGAPPADDAGHGIIVIEADAFGNETTIKCTDSNGFSVNDAGVLVVGAVTKEVDESGLIETEIVTPLHAWAPGRWIKAGFAEPEVGNDEA